MKKRLIWVSIPILLATLGLGAYFIYRDHFSSAFDERLQIALSRVQDPHSYEMLDTTRSNTPDGYLDISGRYGLNFDTRRFQSTSTTTLTLLNTRTPKNTHSFTLQHRSIGDDIYIKIETDSPLLRRTIPYGPDWKHFKATAIPERFVDIAVPGPILDNLALFGKNGAYLTLVGSPVLQEVASSTFHVYTFKLSPKTSEVTAGPLKALIDLIATGTVYVWVEGTSTLHMMHMTGAGYSATSTILHVNTPLDISPPGGTE